jgi:hypothetical protein
MQFELAFPYDIQITPTVNGGVIVRVGCAELSYTSTNKLLTALREYFKDPEQAEKDYHAARKASHGPMATDGRLVAGSGRTVESLGPPETEPPAEVATENTGPDEERTEPD